jgi:hypothetical protein
MRGVAGIVLVGALAATAGAQEVALTPVFSAARGLQDWDLDGNGQWRMTDDALVLHAEGVPGGPIRKPGAMAILKGAPLGSFTLEVDVKSTAPADLLVRDVLLIFGYQSPTRFYYVHLSARTDAVHNGIFLVNDADRRRLDPQTSVARLTDQGWHRVRLVRDAARGDIRVYFDSDPAPALSVIDATIGSGRVGLGSFDETAEFRRLRITGSRP